MELKFHLLLHRDHLTEEKCPLDQVMFLTVLTLFTIDVCTRLPFNVLWTVLHRSEVVKMLKGMLVNCVSISTHSCAHVNNGIELSRKTGYRAPNGLIPLDLRSDHYTPRRVPTARDRNYLN